MPAPRITQTLIVIHQGSQVLLGMKKRGFGAGNWNGFGGKPLKGETVEQAVRRELQEEAGITATDVVKRGLMRFDFEEPADLKIDVHLFSASAFMGEPTETEEMKPRWFSIHEIPFDKMWPDDKYWFPIFLAGKNFNAQFDLKNSVTLLRHEIKEV